MRKSTIVKWSKETMSDFSEACFNDLSIDELEREYRETSASTIDMKIWKITAKQWHDSIKTALAYKLSV